MKLFDCGEFNVTCDGKQKSDIEANPDVAGIGVIVGFLATTMLAFLLAFTVLFLDRYERIRNLFRRHFSQNPDPYVEKLEGVPYWRCTEFWSKVLSKNLLAFSDTQLVTGLAIQFAAIIQHCRLSVYHFQIATELAFLTTVTHLLALVALRTYFSRNKWINLPRVTIMLANLGLLGYTSYIAYSYGLAGLDITTSLACFFQGREPPLNQAFGGYYAVLLVGAIGGHGTIVLAMYFHNEELEEKYALAKFLYSLFRTWLLAPLYAIYGLVMAGKWLRRTSALGNETIPIKGSEKVWGFGQFLPLLLLGLPLLAGWEIFWEEKDENSENRYRDSKHPSRIRLDRMTTGLTNTSEPLSNRRTSRDNSIFEMKVENPTTTIPMPTQSYSSRPSQSTPTRTVSSPMVMTMSPVSSANAMSLNGISSGAMIPSSLSPGSPPMVQTRSVSSQSIPGSALVASPEATTPEAASPPSASPPNPQAPQTNQSTNL